MDRQENRCHLQEKGCGGCPLLSIPYEEQIHMKQKEMKKLMGNFGKVRPVIGMEYPWQYRNKAISTFAEGPGRELISGIYARGTHYVLPVHTCLLHHPRLDEAVRAVRKAARLCKYRPYDEDRKTGLLRHVLVRHSLLTDEVLIVLVTASPFLPGAKTFVKRVREFCPKVGTIVQNINNRSTSAVLGFSEKILLWTNFAESGFGLQLLVFIRLTRCRRRFFTGRRSRLLVSMERRQFWMHTVESEQSDLRRQPMQKVFWV